MAEKSSFAKEEWDDLLRAPLMAGLAVAAASPSGLIGALQEASALSQLLVETKKESGSNPLIDAVVGDLMVAEGRERAKPKGLFGKSAEEVRKEALAAIQRAAAAVVAKDPEMPRSTRPGSPPSPIASPRPPRKVASSASAA